MKMTREEAIKTLKGEAWICCSEKWNEALEMASKALEQEPCDDDLISRQAAIDACLNGWNKDYKEIVEDIRALPPVTLEG